MENLFINDFSSTICDVILQEQKDGHVKEILKILYLKRKLIHSALLCMQSAEEKQSLEDNEAQHMELFVVTHEDEGVLAREVLHGMQPLERNKTKFIQVVFDPGGRELVSSCGKINSFTRT